MKIKQGDAIFSGFNYYRKITSITSNLSDLGLIYIGAYSFLIRDVKRYLLAKIKYEI